MLRRVETTSASSGPVRAFGRFGL